MASVRLGVVTEARQRGEAVWRAMGTTAAHGNGDIPGLY
jgi:hypothetical protein